MLKIRHITLAVMSACSLSAFAQSSVTVFGVVDASLQRIAPTGAGSRTTISTDGNSSSRLGFRGVEDLGSGTAAGFWLEAAFNPNDGSAGSQPSANNQIAGTGSGLSFGRRATLSLIGQNWGEVRLGRDYSPGFWNLSSFSAFGTNGVGSAGYLFYPTPSAARITNVRASNSIGYHLPAMGGVYGQAMVAFGGNASNAGVTKEDGNLLGFRLGYAAGPVDVAVASARTKISALGDLTQTNVGTSYDFGVAKLMALWDQNKTGSNKTTVSMLGARVPVGGNEVRLAYSMVKASGVANDANQLALGYVHNLSKRTALYTNYSRLNNKNNGATYKIELAPTAGGSVTGYEFGIRHSF
jgi:predicted porin